MTGQEWFEVEGDLVGWLYSEEQEQDPMPKSEIMIVWDGSNFWLRGLWNNYLSVRQKDSGDVTRVGDRISFTTNIEEQKGYASVK